MKPSLLFIPDISGFTEFVNRTEVSHSQHIISELLELVIDSNEIGMEVSEIEGDAVLFFKHQDVPDLAALTRQVRNMFVAFHTHLKRYERDRVCQCGACSTANGLTLKIIVHAGDLDFIHIKEHKKLHGSSVILAHRLLKNEVPDREYALFTNFFSSDGLKAEQAAQEWMQPTSGTSSYDDFGQVDYNYLPLASLHEEVTLPPPPPLPPRTKNPITAEIDVACEPKRLFDLVANFDYRMMWNQSAEKIEYNEERINRVGDHHLCIFPKIDLDIETVSGDYGEDKLVYGERVGKFPFMKDVTTYFIVWAHNGGSRLRMESHLRPKPLIGQLMLPVIRKQFLKGAMPNLTALKELCESGEMIIEGEEVL